MEGLMTIYEKRILSHLYQLPEQDFHALSKNTKLPYNILFKSLQNLIIKDLIQYQKRLYSVPSRCHSKVKTLLSDKSMQKMEQQYLINQIISVPEQNDFYFNKIYLDQHDFAFLKSLFRQIEHYLHELKDKKQDGKEEYLITWGANSFTKIWQSAGVAS